MLVFLQDHMLKNKSLRVYQSLNDVHVIFLLRVHPMG